MLRRLENIFQLVIHFLYFFPRWVSFMVAKRKYCEGNCINEQAPAWEIIFVLERIKLNINIIRRRLKGCVNLLARVDILIPILWGVACVCDKSKGFCVSKS